MFTSSRSKLRGGWPGTYPPELRPDAVSLVLDEGRAIADAGGTLGNWVRLERIERGERDGLSADERSECADLRAENAQLRMERDLLELADGDREVEVVAGRAVVVPCGTWHQIYADEPGQLLNITPGPGGQALR